MIRKLDQLLNAITMYRLVVYGLSLLAMVAVVFGATGLVGYSVLSLVTSLLIVMTFGFLASQFFSRTWQVPLNAESGIITCLILFFILQPATDFASYVALGLAAVIAISSKFIIAYRGKHIFNPAALAAAAVGLTGLGHVSWWVGSGSLWPFVLLLGLVVVRKLRKMYVLAVFVGVSIAISTVVALSHSVPVSTMMDLLLTASPLLFLGTIMLTEPSTMPSRRNHQLLFAALVAVLYAAQLKIVDVYIYPEIALLAGNLYAFMLGPKRRWRLTLDRIERVSDTVADYIFTPDAPLHFQPGQYMEWTLAHTNMDARGNRRTFTIASAPEEGDVHLGVKICEPGSSFKRALRTLQPGDSLYAGQIAGDFTLPVNSNEKLLFIAGGIGVTPFRSMIQHVLLTNDQRDIVLIYAASNAGELAYKDVLKTAAKKGIKVTFFINKALTKAALSRVVPDIHERRTYISGPQAMVQTTRQQLRNAGVPRHNIVCDYFSGY